MKQTIEIDVPEGKTAIWKDGKVIFEDIDLPNTWEEFCSIERREKIFYYISDVSSDIYWKIKTTLDSNKDKSLLPSARVAQQHLALMQLHQLRDCYRQGWTHSSGESPSYTIRRNPDSIIIIERTTLYGFLSFQSKEVAEKFLNNFRDLIEQAGDLVC